MFAASKSGADVVGAVASDNYPCYNGTVVFSDTTIGPYVCTMGVARVVRRVFSAKDHAGNPGTAQTDITVFDDIPPQLAGVPDSPNASLPASYVRGGAMQRDTKVTATDNVPQCFSGRVPYSQHVLPDPTPPTCALRQLYTLKRTWAAVDDANNTASFVQTVSVLDDEKISLGALVLRIDRRNKSALNGVYTQTVRVPDPTPRKVRM